MGQESILAKQRYFQSVHKLTHLKAPGDKITSVIIPFALIGLGTLMMARGLNHLYHSTGKKEGF
ncbi:unnamed protein product [Calypogeia fissa]